VAGSDHSHGFFAFVPHLLVSASGAAAVKHSETRRKSYAPVCFLDGLMHRVKSRYRPKPVGGAFASENEQETTQARAPFELGLTDLTFSDNKRGFLEKMRIRARALVS
jgi:hypothetical protein